MKNLRSVIPGRPAGLILLLLAIPLTGASQVRGADIDSLGWMAGCWEGTYANGRTVTEQWMKPSGKTMMGSSRTVKGGKTIDFEFVRLEQSEDGVIRYIAHPSGQTEAAFTLVKLDARVALFENLEYDFPQRVIYRRVSFDSLAARVEGSLNGRHRGSDFPYRRVKCE